MKKTTRTIPAGFGRWLPLLCWLAVISTVTALQPGPIVSWSGNDHLYQGFVSSNRITWAEAQSDAAMRGGYLATATSEAENQFIFDLINSTNYLNPVVLGAIQPPGSPEPDGNWQWITGEPWGYENWYTGYTIEPNNFGGSQNIIQYWGREPASWDDTSRAGGLRSYIVEYQVHASATGGLSLAIGGDSPLAARHPLQMIGMLDGVATMLIWDFDDGSYATNRQFVSHSWTMPGDYDVVLTAFNGTVPGGVSATQTFHVISLEDATAYVTTDGDDSNDGSSWASAKATIQGGVDAVVPGGVVYVSNGTYVASNEIQVHKSVTVQSVSDPEETIVDGGGSKRCFSLGYDCILSGFTITNGYDGLTGGGILSDDNASIITNCIIIGNTAVDNGGGVRNGTLHDCTVSQNTSLNQGGGLHGGVAYDCIFSFNIASNRGGGISGSTAYGCELSDNIAITNGGGAWSADLYDCDIVGNRAGADGGGYNCWGTKTIMDCRIVGNTATGVGGGIYIAGGCSAINCTISSNSADKGGGCNSWTGGTLTNCRLEGNTATNIGGGIYFGKDGMAVNCTISSNSASTGGGIYCYTGGLLENCIIWNNEADSGDNWNNNGAGSYSYCCTTPEPGGIGNITNAPLFIGLGNYRLATNSPCINAGSNAYVSVATDLDGHPRIVDGTVDMGAYESGFEGFFITNFVPAGSETILEWMAFPMWKSTVKWSTNLVTMPFADFPTTLPYPLNSYTDTVHGGESECFYKVELSP